MTTTVILAYISVLLWGCSYCHLGYGQQSWPNILIDLDHHTDLRQFTQLVRDTDLARKFLTYREMTIFAPTDEAFDEFRGRYDRHLVLYHMIPNAMTTSELQNAIAQQETFCESIMEEFPHLWLSKTKTDGATDSEGKIYVNEAMLITNQTNYTSKSRSDIYGKLQILHKINKVLSPMATTTVSPTAYDFLSQTNSWPLVAYSFNNFYKRVITSKLEQLYKEPDHQRQQPGKTFLIPADEFRTAMEDSEITASVIRCAIISQVAFVTMDTIGNNYETLNAHCHVTIINGSVINVRDTLRGLSKTIQILIANIPLKNGVLHVVRHMPGLFRPKMAPMFPFRSLWEQVNNSWYLQTATHFLDSEKVRKASAEIAQMVNGDDAHTDLNYTLFLPQDSNWETFVQANGKSVQDLEQHQNLGRFMKRHISNEYFDMKRLVEVSRLSLRKSNVILGSGEEKIMAKFVQDDEEDIIKIYWGTKVIKVIRANIQCTNGILHIIDSPFIFDDEIVEPTTLLKIWRSLSKILY